MRGVSICHNKKDVSICHNIFLKKKLNWIFILVSVRVLVNYAINIILYP
jgi:hypothetical protein